MNILPALVAADDDLHAARRQRFVHHRFQRLAHFKHLHQTFCARARVEFRLLQHPIQTGAMNLEVACLVELIHERRHPVQHLRYDARRAGHQCGYLSSVQAIELRVELRRQRREFFRRGRGLRRSHHLLFHRAIAQHQNQ